MLSNDYLPMIGGVSNHVHQLSRGLMKNGHAVRILHICYSEQGPAFEEIDGIEVYRCEVTRNLADRKSILAKVWRYLATLIKGRPFLKHHIREFQPDVLHWHDYYHSSLLTKLVKTRARMVCTNHSAPYLERYEKGGIWWPCLRFLVSHTDFLIGPSQELADKSIITGKPAPFIPNGVDVDLFTPRNRDRSFVCSEHNIDPDAMLVMAPRRLDPKNGLLHLVRALPEIVSRVPKAHLIIVGGGPEELAQSYMDIAASNNVADHFTITGRVPYQEMQRYLPSADLVVIPSLLEAVSLSALEALASGIPVIASDVGGLPFIINDENGALVPPTDEPALADAVARHLSDPQLLQTKGEAARRGVVENFSWKTIGARTHELYETPTEAI